MANNILPDFSNVRALVQATQDDIINNLGVDPEGNTKCMLLFRGEPGFCPNCIFDSLRDVSSNRYKAGGPIAFGAGEICPVCNGTGRAPGTDRTEPILLHTTHNLKNYQKNGTDDPNVRIPQGALQTKGYAADLDRVLACDYLIYHGQYQYKLIRDTMMDMNIVQKRYFICLWARATI